MKIDDLAAASIVSEINKLALRFQDLSNEDIRDHIKKIESVLTEDNNSVTQLNSALIPAYALVKEVARRFTLGNIEVSASELDRCFAAQYDFLHIEGDKAIYHNHWYALTEEFIWNMVHYDEQILAGIYLHQGYAIEMATGEGKTLAATMPIILNGLTHKGVHVMTVNDYLSKRDCELMRPLYMFFGLTVDCLEYTKRHDIYRKVSYKCDVIFGTNSSFTFDYLFDHLSKSPEECVQTNHFFAIIDELDSILIDEAQTPHIISGRLCCNQSELYKHNKEIIEELLDDDSLYIVNKAERTCRFTEKGKEWLVEKSGIKNLYKIENYERKNAHLIDLTDQQKEIEKNIYVQNAFYQLLYAYTILQKDVDYIVSKGEIIIIDTNTGRTKENNRWNDGLHTAVEVKENVSIKPDSLLEAVISLKNYFRLYDKISGMSGTISSCAEELKDTYNLDFKVVPTHRKTIRKDEPIRLFKTQEQKYYAIVEYIKKNHAKGRPLLVGCKTIKQAELLHKILYDDKIQANLLTAKTFEKEAYYISKAGQDTAITVATSMAGRGTDIKLSSQAKNSGGLVVIGTDLFDSVRVEYQLRGRSGRQGDPGTSIIFVSMEDDIINYLDPTDSLQLKQLAIDEKSGELCSSIVHKLIEKAQRNCELKYKKGRELTAQKDDIIAPYRKDFYDFRNRVLFDASYADVLISKVLQESEKEMSAIDEHLRVLYETTRTLLHQSSLNDRKQTKFYIPFSDAAHLFVVKVDIQKALESFDYFKKEYKRQVVLDVYDKYWIRFIRYVMSLLGNRSIEKIPNYFMLMKNDICHIILSRLICSIIPIGMSNTTNAPIPYIAVTESLKDIDRKSKFSQTDMCPCGSGKKYSECHGKGTRKNKRRF